MSNGPDPCCPSLVTSPSSVDSSSGSSSTLLPTTTIATTTITTTAIATTTTMRAECCPEHPSARDCAELCALKDQIEDLQNNINSIINRVNG